MESSSESAISVNIFKSITSDMKDQIIKEFEKSFELLKKRVNFLEQSMDKIKRNVNMYERDRKRKNVIIKGLIENETDQKNLELRITHFLKEKLGVQLQETDIDIVFRIGKSEAAGKKSRHVILKLTTEQKKTDIMRNKWKLKNTKFYIDNDLPKEVLEKQFLDRQVRRASMKDTNHGTKIRRSSRNSRKMYGKPKSKTPISKSYGKKLDTLPNTASQLQ
jgi:hypothetical protein